MNVKEMIKWLETQDQDAIVQVVSHQRGSGYYEQGGTASVEDFTIEFAYGPESPQYGKYYEYDDYWKNRFENPDFAHVNGKTFLLLGQYDQ